MFKNYSQFFACLLLVLMPLQGIAAANMSICNSLMQSYANQNVEVVKNMPCHDSMNGNVQDTKKHSEKSTCKTSCAALCASLGTTVALPSNVTAASSLAPSALVHFSHQTYISITQPNLQRPPISFI